MVTGREFLENWAPLPVSVTLVANRVCECVVLGGRRSITAKEKKLGGVLWLVLTPTTRSSRRLWLYAHDLQCAVILVEQFECLLYAVSGRPCECRGCRKHDGVTSGAIAPLFKVTSRPPPSH